MNGFHGFNLEPSLLKALAELGFTTPTPVQAAVIPVLLEGRRNMVALAQTGTGKTAAFGIPMLQRLEREVDAVQTVILCPTRELCLQVCRDIKNLAKHTARIRTVAIYGGAPIEPQLKAIGNGVQIVVATPGRLHDILRRRRVDLSRASCVVLDEADEMLSMGFEEDLNAIMAAIPDTVQKLLFSATMPKALSSLVSSYVKEPVEITIGNRGEGAENVTHHCYIVHEKDRYAALRRIVDAYPGMYGLVFCRTRLQTQEIAASLIKDGYSADALHGELTQIQRDRVMKTFRDRSLNLLVATDVAARGLDISDLSHVINYQLPDELQSYTHRSGRTGRAGKGGISIALINMREKFKIHYIEKQLGKRFEIKTVPTGREVCEARLGQFIVKVCEVNIEDARIDPYLPQVMERLKGMPPETLIRRFVALEFNRFLDFYQDSPDLNAESAHGETRRPISDDRVSLIVNAGRVDSFNASTLMSLLNRGGRRGNTVSIGRVEVKQEVTFFDVSRDDAELVIKLIGGQRMKGRALKIAPVRPEDGGPAPGKPASPPRSKPADGRRAPHANAAPSQAARSTSAPHPKKRPARPGGSKGSAKKDDKTPGWVRTLKRSRA